MCIRDSWNTLFTEAAPMLSFEGRDFILMIAGTSAINPVIILTSLILDNKIDGHQTDASFHEDVTAFAKNVLNQYMDFTDNSQYDTNIGLKTLLEVLEHDYDKLKRFLFVYNYLKEQIVKKHGGSYSNPLEMNARNSQPRVQDHQDLSLIHI